MSECSFSIELNNSAEEVVRMAKEAIVGAGGKFSGDNGSGEFSLSAGIGSMKGSYSVKGEAMKIVISKKPMLVGCSRIEKEIRKYLEADED